MPHRIGRNRPPAGFPIWAVAVVTVGVAVVLGLAVGVIAAFAHRAPGQARAPAPNPAAAPRQQPQPQPPQLGANAPDHFAPAAPPPRRPNELLPKYGNGPPEKAKVFTPRNGMYTAQMPAGDRVRTLLKIYDVGRHKVPLEGSEVEVGGVTYSAASLGIPAVVIREIPADERCDVICDAMFINSRQGKLLGKAVIQQQPAEGREFLVQLPDSVARLQVYTIAGWVVMGIVEGKDVDAVESPQADAFLEGVALTDQAKKLYREVTR